MLKKILLIVLGFPFAVLAQSENQLIDRYTALAGSRQNATSLVTGLREGRQVTLTRGTSTQTFTPPTGTMGYGNVDNALALAQASLAQRGITQPTPAQLQASVMDVLKLRADGQGWGQIAQSYGIKLGDVKRADKAERVARTENPAKVERPERPERPEKPERPGKGR